jgi:hypothetical protein
MYRKERIRKKAINIYIEQKNKKKPLIVYHIFLHIQFFRSTQPRTRATHQEKKKNRGVIELCISVSFD